MAKGYRGISISNHELKELVRRKEKEGWTLVPKRKHLVLYPPGVDTASRRGVCISTTPNKDPRSFRNTLASLKRAERQAKTKERGVTR